MLKEVSAGGLVVWDGKVLMVKVTNLKGEVVWTFPKGHLESGETARQAALREVQEETGWACRIKASLCTAHYHFLRKGRPVDKKVRWYLMAPLKKVGRRDPEEIMAVRWVAAAAAPKKLSYPSDLKLLQTHSRRTRA